MDFVLGIVIGVVSYMIYNKTIKVKGETGHWIIDIHKEDNDES